MIEANDIFTKIEERKKLLSAFDAMLDIDEYCMEFTKDVLDYRMFGDTDDNLYKLVVSCSRAYTEIADKACKIVGSDKEEFVKANMAVFPESEELKSVDVYGELRNFITSYQGLSSSIPEMSEKPIDKEEIVKLAKNITKVYSCILHHISRRGDE